MANQVMRITLKGIRSSVSRCICCKRSSTLLRRMVQQLADRFRFQLRKEVVTILRAVHKYKDSREQFEQRTHKRLIDIIAPTQKTVDALSRLEMPAGVHIDIKMKQNRLVNA